MITDRGFIGLNQCHPTPPQELLLKASLLKGEAARRAYLDWERLAATSDLDILAFKFLPFLRRNGSEIHLEPSRHQELEAIYRCNQLRNFQRFHTISEVLELLNGAGVPVIALKGAVLAEHYYRDLGLRFLEDFDFLVPSDKGPEVYRLLLEVGWSTPVQPSRNWFLMHAIGLENSSEQKIDLHWHLYETACHPTSDKPFWDASVPTTVGGVSCRILSVTDQLYHTCINGPRAGAPPRIVWVADALAVLQAPLPIDWDRLLELAIRFREIAIVRATLNYLKMHFDAPVPGEILRTLNAKKIEGIDELEYRVRTGASRKGPLAALRINYNHFTRSVGAIRTPAKLLQFMQVAAEPYRGANQFRTTLNVLKKVLHLAVSPRPKATPRNPTANQVPLKGSSAEPVPGRKE